MAGPSTIHRLEGSHPDLAAKDRYCKIALDQSAADDLLVELMIEANESPPEEIILDLDATDDRIHGQQVGRFFHGYNDSYCFLPLYIFCGDHLLCAKLLKIGARVRITVRRIWISMSESYPYADLLFDVWRRLQPT